MKLKNPQGKVILITGASTGIGRYVAEYFARKNYLILAGARKQIDIDSLNCIPNITGLKLDVSNSANIHEVKDYVKQHFGYIDVLINNAGIIGWGAIMDRNMQYFRNIFEVNLFGIIEMTKTFYPLLKASNSNPIVINISSQGGSYTFPYWTPYSMTKYALESFSDGLRREFHSQGIRVTIIKPGAITSNAFHSKKISLEDYRSKYDSIFSKSAANLIEMGMLRPSKKEKSPNIVARDIEHAITHKNSKIRYNSGRRIIPDMIMSKLPQKSVDLIFRKLLKKI